MLEGNAFIILKKLFMYAPAKFKLLNLFELIKTSHYCIHIIINKI